MCVFSIFEQLERAYQYELWAFVTMIGVATFLYSISGYLKAVILAFRLKGPKAMFIIGNTLMIGSKDREYFTQNIFYFFFSLFILGECVMYVVAIWSSARSDQIWFVVSGCLDFYN